MNGEYKGELSECAVFLSLFVFFAVGVVAKVQVTTLHWSFDTAFVAILATAAVLIVANVFLARRQ